MLQEIKIKSIVSRIAHQFNPQQVILFGSYAYGEPNQDSDLDLLVIDDQHHNKQIIATEISRMLFPREYGLDVVVTSPEDFQEKSRRGLSFWKEILTRGTKLYEQ